MKIWSIGTGTIGQLVLNSLVQKGVRCHYL
jgi:hypothetical protein